MKEIKPKKLFDYIRGIERAIKYLNMAVLAGGIYTRDYESYYDELDAKERELQYIHKVMARTPIFQKCFQVNFDTERMEVVRKSFELTKTKFNHELKEETYYLTQHIVVYEEKCENE